MPTLTITASADGKRFDPDEAGALRLDLEREVGDVQLPAATADGAKGLAIDFATLAVAVLSAPAVTALIGLLQARLERDNGTEFILEGPGGKMTLKARDKSLLNSADLSRVIERVLGGEVKGMGDASGSSGSGQPV